MANFKDSIGYVLAMEGGYVDHPKDPGGPTFWGISLRFLEGLPEGEGDIDKDGDVDKFDILSLTPETAKALYKKNFWEPLNLDDLKSQAVATRILDMAVNMGLKRSVKIAQKAYNSLLEEKGTKLKIDGKLGPKTKKALNSIDPVEMMSALREHHEEFYRGLVEKNDRYAVFLDGWVNRARA